MGPPPQIHTRPGWVERVYDAYAVVLVPERAGCRNDLLLGPLSFLERTKFHNGVSIYVTVARWCGPSRPFLCVVASRWRQVKRPGWHWQASENS